MALAILFLRAGGTIAFIRAVYFAFTGYKGDVAFFAGMLVGQFGMAVFCLWFGDYLDKKKKSKLLKQGNK